MTPAERIPLAEITAARERISGHVLRTPLVHLNVDDTPAEVYLKLENLQPIGAFKLRGASNVMLQSSPDELARGVWTASAGNMAQGVAWQARRMGVPCTVVAPDHAPRTKLDAIARLGARAVTVPFAEWFEILSTRAYPGVEGVFIHPFNDPRVMAGNGTIGLEILEDLPDVETILIPFGGGGLSCGIASAVRALKPGVRIYAAEAETSAPVAAAFAADAPVTIAHLATFIDGSGAPAVKPEMWPLVRDLLDGARVVPLAAVAAAVRLLLERNRVLAEGAGALPVAAALREPAGGGPIVCVVSGGNLDTAKLATILRGEVP
jgi:threonine dehydratase